MSLFTVEVVTAAAPTETAMEQLRRFLDLVPGTVLIEDPVEPHLMFPIEAATSFEAVRFVDGLAKIADLTIASGRVYETPYEEFGSTVTHPLIAGLLSLLPAPGSPLTSEERTRWLDTFDMNLAFIYPVVEQTTDEDYVDPDADAGKDPAAVALGRKGGRKGGLARAAKLSAEERSAIARRAAQARWTEK